MSLKIEIETDNFYFYKIKTGFCTDSRLATVFIVDYTIISNGFSFEPPVIID